jgi:ABC-type transport system substrate-binding protein
MKTFHQLAAGVALCMAVFAAPAAAQERKVLKLAFTKAETSLDPARIVDLYSRNLTAHIFEALYQYDHLARPSKIKPLTADGPPEVSADFRVWTVKLKPGITFADDPAFKGRKRELVAEDYVYALKRMVDPANKSPVVAGVLDTKYVGLAPCAKPSGTFQLRHAGRRPKAIDRYTIRYARGAAAASKAWPAPTSVARWPAKWSSSMATRSTAIRWAPGPFA